MRRVSLDDAVDRELGRPVRDPDGAVLLVAGTRLDADRIAALRGRGVDSVVVCEPGEVPPRAPAYGDRYAPDFPEELRRRFARHRDDPLMQELLRAALRHAGQCSDRYRPGNDGRLDDDDA